MSLSERLFPHDVSYWPRTGQDRYGKPTFGAVQHLRGRWEDRMETIQGKSGGEVIAKTRVYMKNQDIDVDGFMAKGVRNEPNPINEADVWEVQQVGKMPDLRGLSELTVVYL